MGRVIITCQTIKSEVGLAIQETGVDYPVLSVDSGLHDNPALLRKAIQEQMDRIDNVDTIYMALGFCGNALLGIKSVQARLIIPRADDCISLLLGSYELRRQISAEAGTYFLTKGWLDGESNLLTEYERCVGKYGPERALKVMKTLMGHYRRLMVIDTKAYALEDILNRTIAFAQKIGMKHAQFPGSLRFLKKLLLGPWDEEFIILEPGNELAFDALCLDGSGGQPPYNQFLSAPAL